MPTSRFHISLSCLIAFISGIVIQESFHPQLLELKLPTILTLLTFLIFLTLLKALKFVKHSTLFITITVLTILLFFSAGFLRAHSTEHIPNPNTIDYYASEEGTEITLTGTLIAEPDIRRDKVNYTIQVETAKLQDQVNTTNDVQWSEDHSLPTIDDSISGTILISTGKYPVYEYGDVLEISGRLQQPTSFDTFDYAGYLSRYGIYAVMYRPYIKPIKKPSGSTKKNPINKNETSKMTSGFSVFEDGPEFNIDIWGIKHWFIKNMLKLKQQFEQQMNKTFSTEPYSSFMAGLLLGSRKGIPEELSEAFRVTGLTHIIAISGYNITLIVSILMGLFKPLGRKASVFLAGLGVILFTVFVGASPAVVRACIMGLIALFALNSDRKGNITLTLTLTACLMIGWNPKILFYDVGFQLSFLATMGLIYVSPLLEPYFMWLPKKLAIRESILLTLSAQIMALPIILFNFQNLSVVSPVSNLLIAGPILPLAMLFGFMGTIVSFIWLPLAKLMAYPAYWLLQYVTNVTWATSKIPYAMVEVTWFSNSFFMGYFIFLTIVLVRKWSQAHQKSLHISHIKLLFNSKIHQAIYA